MGVQRQPVQVEPLGQRPLQMLFSLEQALFAGMHTPSTQAKPSRHNPCGLALEHSSPDLIVRHSPRTQASSGGSQPHSPEMGMQLPLIHTSPRGQSPSGMDSEQRLLELMSTHPPSTQACSGSQEQVQASQVPSQTPEQHSRPSRQKPSGLNTVHG